MGGPTTKNDRVKKLQLDTGATAEEAAAIDAQIESARVARTNAEQATRAETNKAVQNRGGTGPAELGAQARGGADVKTANLRNQPGGAKPAAGPAALALPDANALLTDMKIKAGRAAPDATDIALKARQEAQAQLLTGASKRGRKSTFLTGPLGG